MAYLLDKPSPILAFLLLGLAFIVATAPRPAQSHPAKETSEAYALPRDVYIRSDLSYLPAATRTERMMELRDGAVLEIDRRLAQSGTSPHQSQALKDLRSSLTGSSNFAAVRCDVIELDAIINTRQ